MRRHPSHARIVGCQQCVGHQCRRAQDIADIMIDFCDGLTNVGEPLTLPQRQQGIALQRIKSLRGGDKVP